jgi:hypothetical protein
MGDADINVQLLLYSLFDETTTYLWLSGGCRLQIVQHRCTHLAYVTLSLVYHSLLSQLSILPQPVVGSRFRRLKSYLSGRFLPAGPCLHQLYHPCFGFLFLLLVHASSLAFSEILASPVFFLQSTTLSGFSLDGLLLGLPDSLVK